MFWDTVTLLENSLILSGFASQMCQAGPEQYSPFPPAEAGALMLRSTHLANHRVSNLAGILLSPV